MAEAHPNQSRIIKAGEFARDFALADTAGKVVRLSAVLANGPVVIVFYRGDW